MSTINTNPGSTAAPADPYVNSVLQSVTQPPPAPPAGSKFRSVLGGIVAGAGNLVMPGVGSVLGNMISGGSGSLLGAGTQQMLQYQAQMLQEQQQFEMQSTILKNRSDAVMSAIRNMKAS